MPPRIKKQNAANYIKKVGEIRRSQTVSTRFTCRFSAAFWDNGGN